jgi:hypothetical protein
LVALVAVVVVVVLPLTLTGDGRSSAPRRSVRTIDRWSVPPSAVRWAWVAYPITGGCGTDPVQVQQVSWARPPGGPELALVLVRCQNGAELPASSLFAYDGALSSARPVLLATLLDAAEDEIVTGGFHLHGGSVSVQAAGYSSPAVPQCCPDVRATLEWIWERGRFERVR